MGPVSRQRGDRRVPVRRSSSWRRRPNPTLPQSQQWLIIPHPISPCRVRMAAAAAGAPGRRRADAVSGPGRCASLHIRRGSEPLDLSLRSRAQNERLPGVRGQHKFGTGGDRPVWCVAAEGSNTLFVSILGNCSYFGTWLVERSVGNGICTSKWLSHRPVVPLYAAIDPRPRRSTNSRAD